jgi:hypothetical protein
VKYSNAQDGRTHRKQRNCTVISINERYCILTVNNAFCFATTDKIFYYVASVLTTCFGPHIRPSSGELKNIKKEALFIQRIRCVE